MRKKSGFNLFYQALGKKVEGIHGLNNPALARKRCRPNYNIPQFVSGHDELSNRAEQYYPCAVKEHFKDIYFERYLYDI